MPKTYPILLAGDADKINEISIFIDRSLENEYDNPNVIFPRIKPKLRIPPAMDVTFLGISLEHLYAKPIQNAMGIIILYDYVDSDEIQKNMNFLRAKLIHKDIPILLICQDPIERHIFVARSASTMTETKTFIGGHWLTGKNILTAFAQEIQTFDNTNPAVKIKLSLSQRINDYLIQRSNNPHKYYSIFSSLFGGISRDHKLRAAHCLQQLILNPDGDHSNETEHHLPALTQGELGKIYKDYLKTHSLSDPLTRYEFR